jgi:sterol 14alpha-demethylase
MSDDAIAHMMIATLMGGQHTSSTTTSWILFELARRPDIVQRCLDEQSQVLIGKPGGIVEGKDGLNKWERLPDFDYDQLNEMTFLDCIMKETLRLHPPIHTIMRKVEKELVYKGSYRIPPGHFLCGSGAVSQLDPERFPDPKVFDPDRFMPSRDGQGGQGEEGQGEWELKNVNVSQKSARSYFLPFGAGRHRCIGT